MTDSNAASGRTRSFLRVSEHDSAPLYEVVKRHICEAILLGEWASGTVIPSEMALASDFGVSVGTVRRALAELVAEGMLMRRRKTGTVVTGWAPLHNLRYFFQYFRLHSKAGALLKSRTLLLDYQLGAASPLEAQQLLIEEGSAVYRLHRLRSIDGVAAMHERFTLVACKVPNFPGPEALPELLYRFLLDQYGLRVAAVREQLTAGLASDEDCRLLDLTAPHAVMVIDAVSFDQAATPVMMTHQRASTDHFMYVNEVR
ncbi:GntR family transcriptional regulator [Pseudomonas sp. nanlin1]|uniref:GntR family transcriptional regulator n=1 Tax=Pseudomonas sp. nanlin1 TaxID=3040605 RepID=UPI003890376D